MAREGAICNKCAECEPKPEDVPEEYRELFQAARVLFDENVTDEYTIIPTLAFAANYGKRPRLASVRDRFMEVHDKYEEAGMGHEARESEEWRKLDNEFFLNASATLLPLDMKEGVLIICSVPIEVTFHEDEETGLPDKATIRVFRRSASVGEVVDSYKRALERRGVSYDDGRGSIEPTYLSHRDHITDCITIAVRHATGTRRGGFESSFEAWRQGPFPGPNLFGAVYSQQRELWKERLDKTHGTPPEGTKKTEPMKPYNLIPACVYWYVGGWGAVLGSPRGSALKRTTHDLIKKHLLDPCADKLPEDRVRSDLSRDAGKAQQRIRCINNELRLQAARIVPLMSR